MVGSCSYKTTWYLVHMPGPAPIAPAIRYLDKVDKRGPEECWEWSGGRFEKGYGAFRLSAKRMVKAHRFGFELLIGPIPAGLYVCHTCDNPPCQNPRHWFLGTHKDNAHDREQKMRGRYKTLGPLPPKPKVGRARGERDGNAKLTEADVLEIRRLSTTGVSQRSIAERFGITQVNVSSIARRRTWAHL
jgi:hypothetical protein